MKATNKEIIKKKKMQESKGKTEWTKKGKMNAEMHRWNNQIKEKWKKKEINKEFMKGRNNETEKVLMKERSKEWRNALIKVTLTNDKK